MASPLLRLLCHVCTAATGLHPAGPWQSWSSLGLATGIVVAEHRRSWAGVSAVPAPDPSTQLAVSGDTGWVVVSPWHRGWWGCEPGSGRIGRLVPCSSGHWEGQAASQPALVPSGSRFPGTAELQPLPRPLTLPKPDAQVTLALTSLSSAGTQLTGASRLPVQLPDGGRERGSGGQLPPRPFHPCPSGHLPVRPLGCCRSHFNGNIYI